MKKKLFKAKRDFLSVPTFYYKTGSHPTLGVLSFILCCTSWDQSAGGTGHTQEAGVGQEQQLQILRVRNQGSDGDHFGQKVLFCWVFLK